MEQLYKEGRIIQTRKGNARRCKRYLDEMSGVPLQDIWGDIKPASTSSESLGYPTQKPETLLQRIINSSSNSMDIVLDPFCGCGTILVAAHRLGRTWIAIDISPTACRLRQKRLRRDSRLDIHKIGLPWTAEELKPLQPFEFQNWVFEKLHGRVNPRKIADMGIDGSVDLDVPVQVKQSESIGRNVVDNFGTVLRRVGKNRGGNSWLQFRK